MPERQNANRLTTENDAVRDSFTATLIHSCCSKKQQPALGQISISRVGQYSISADKQRFFGPFLGHGWATIGPQGILAAEMPEARLPKMYLNLPTAY
jgi:hypothetical protein